MDDKTFEYELLKVLYNKERMTALAEKIEELTGCPVYFVSVNIELIAKSCRVRNDDIITKYMILGNDSSGVPTTYSEFSDNKSKISRLLSKSPYYAKLGNRSFLFVNSYMYSNHTGSLVFPGYEKSREKISGSQLEIMTRIFSLCMSVSLGYTEHLETSNWEKILLQLINGEISDLNSLEHAIKSNNTMLAPGKFRLFIFSVRGINIRLHPEYEKLIEYLNRQQNFRCWIEYEENIVLLINDRARVQDIPGILSDGSFVRFLEKSSIKTGYSEQSSDLLSVPLLYYQAQISVNYSNRWNAVSGITGYEDCKLYNLLYNSKSPSGSLRFFVTDRIGLIRKYDETNGTKYMRIISALIKNRFNLTAASKELYMHKSTLSYHVKKISELFNIDFDNREQMLHFELSLYILRFFID